MTITELFSELAQETGTLVRQEVKLATTEMTAKAAEAGKQAGLAAVGAALLYAGVLALVAAAGLALAHVMAGWLAALIVGLVAGVCGYLLAQKGIDGLKRVDPAPRTTLQTLQEDRLWVKEQLR